MLRFTQLDWLATALPDLSRFQWIRSAHLFAAEGSSGTWGGKDVALLCGDLFTSHLFVRVES
ncbi:hypothetical protein Plhal304r1_c060g0146641 [Plasmopara halstedii]